MSLLDHCQGLGHRTRRESHVQMRGALQATLSEFCWYCNDLVQNEPDTSYNPTYLRVIWPGIGAENESAYAGQIALGACTSGAPSRNRCMLSAYQQAYEVQALLIVRRG